MRTSFPLSPIVVDRFGYYWVSVASDINVQTFHFLAYRSRRITGLLFPLLASLSVHVSISGVVCFGRCDDQGHCTAFTR